MQKILVFLLILTVFPFQLTAQEEARAKSFDIDAQQLLKSNEQMIPQPQLLEQALEKEIDSTTYLVGPGDKILIKVWGPLENQFITEVTPEGFLVIPTIAEINVSGLTLSEVAEKTKTEMRRFFKKASFSIRLIKMRKFRVHVVGEIQLPGTYYLRPSDRISDAIQLAGGLIQWGDDTRIVVRHLTGDPDTVNVSNYYLTGSMQDNPTVLGGDVIYIPPINLQKNYVIIEGNVGSEGIYQFRPQENLFVFLTRIRAINRKSNVDQIILIRGDRKAVFNLLSKKSLAHQEILQTGDRIIVPTNRDRVYVRGEVTQPGPYPYLANYTAKDYAGFAGLLETAKDLDEIKVIRAESGKIEKGKNLIVQKGDLVVIPRRNREVFKDYLTIFTPIISVGLSVYAIIQSSRK